MQSNIHSKQLAAIELAIGALTRERRTHYAVGEHAYQSGILPDILNNTGTQAELFTFAEESHKKYQQYTKAIQQLEDLKEILTDEGITIEQPALFEKE